MKKLINIIVIGFIIISTLINLYYINKLDDLVKERIEVLDVEPEIVFVDSLVYDTVYIERYEQIKLPIVDTLVLTDTLVSVDSVFVEIPISTYKFDTTLNETYINLICDGFDVRLNSLLVERINVAQKQEKPLKRWYEDIHLGVGLGITYVDRFRVTPTLGIYYKLF